MVQSPVQVMTLTEFLLLKETKPANEFIDGQITQKPMPQGKHSLIQGQLVINLEAALKPQKIARAYPELRCSFGGRSTVPDVAVFTSDRIPRDENGDVANVFSLAPDWTIEILSCSEGFAGGSLRRLPCTSPDQSQTKVTKNILYCLQYDTQMGWLIDLADRSVFVYSFDRSTQVFDEDTDVLPVPEFAKGFRLTLGDLFGWLRD